MLLFLQAPRGAILDNSVNKFFSTCIDTIDPQSKEMCEISTATYGGNNVLS